MTPRKKLFADYYLTNGFNATQAAEFAGYKNKNNINLRMQGSRLKKDPEVKKYIESRLKELDEHFKAKQGELLKFWTRVLRDEETEEKVLYKVIIDSEGEAQEFIKHVEVKADLRTRLKSSEYLANYYQMFEKRENTGNTKVTIIRGNKK